MESNSNNTKSILKNGSKVESKYIEENKNVLSKVSIQPEIKVENKVSNPTEDSKSETITFEENPKVVSKETVPVPVPVPVPKEENDNNKVNDVKTHNENFTKIIENYVKANNPHVCILTPCFASMCYVNYVYCLINTINIFSQLKVQLSIEFCKNDSLVSRARNNLIAKAMAKKEVTHMIFIDNDITWDPIDILKLMISDKSLIGGVYPLKKYNWNHLLVDQKNPQNVNNVNNINLVQQMIDRKDKSELKNAISDENMIQHNLLKYNTNFLDNVLTIHNNLTKVKHIATGFMMIKRATIEKMSIAFPSTKYTDDVGFLVGDENKYAYALFDCGVEDDHYFSEDWLFCHRWSKMGGNVYIDVSINLKHTGIEDYNGSFIASLI